MEDWRGIVLNPFKYVFELNIFYFIGYHPQPVFIFDAYVYLAGLLFIG